MSTPSDSQDSDTQSQFRECIDFNNSTVGLNNDPNRSAAGHGVAAEDGAKQSEYPAAPHYYKLATHRVFSKAGRGSDIVLANPKTNSRDPHASDSESDSVLSMEAVDRELAMSVHVWRNPPTSAPAGSRTRNSSESAEESEEYEEDEEKQEEGSTYLEHIYTTSLSQIGKFRDFKSGIDGKDMPSLESSSVHGSLETDIHRSSASSSKDTCDPFPHDLAGPALNDTKLFKSNITIVSTSNDSNGEQQFIR